ncbi:phosphodiester glycosidase family protein [Lutimaribacter sp. EGI FJ00015]|uniref:Phosphodiester glycosidase family protein n=1 Tax=Lutimaribacter degradans TaxID=2945989 RepID=A0ACC5ZUJ8_9RHOB|nr:phosphodiester glycosidase family protein [Lutimaribacter sp. EGI FJ00013]MCM2561850.1 phosphodiester glycosidase family protein [Lutimaribacter sp. EGI FJ00013]MCO0613118.1 phosphodiester glycosidase family protein [Lutimaribacter sp. EGI FJ00015]MCO0635682.1 phosphodiester glycosidase family protein [Lutimaribacter sp. EGI FJ00014]
MMRLRATIALIVALAAAPALAVDCHDMSHEDNTYTVCAVDAGKEDLRLFLDNPQGAKYGHFTNIDTQLTRNGQQLGFAMNAGMYHPDRAPVGHYVEDGQEKMHVISSAGSGNFGLLPNGVFCIREDRADVIETRSFLEQAPNCRYATQSGPMLVIDGALHPRFLPDSTSRFVRNGVGTSADGQTAYFAISQGAVTFHQFAQLFRDALKTPNALYFDGNISRLHAPMIGRSDPGFRMGPIVGIVEPAD